MDSTYQILSHFYDCIDEHARLEPKHGQVEFLTTVRYIEKYLRKDMRILEIGAGTGRYSHFFAQRGYSVDAVELVLKNIAEFNKRTLPEEKMRIFEGNAMDLSFLPDESYEITLLLGPMYHLFTEADKLRALSEAIRVTKKGGVIFAAYCSADASILCYGFIRGNIKMLIEKGLVVGEDFRALSSPAEVFELHRKEDIDRLMSHFDVQQLHYVGTDMAANYIRETLDAMDDEAFNLYMQYHFAICERPDMVGATHHILDVFRKK